MDIRETLFAQTGPVMGPELLCKLLHYPSQAALQAARARGKLPFRPVRLEGRRGVYAWTEDVIGILERAGRSRDEPEQPDPEPVADRTVGRP